ncbi:hypothetical protein BF95_25800 [Sphingobium sp. Ant17]|nr:hypothetical protein BF95_25800 [Sphingobium sp. Ant17]
MRAEGFSTRVISVFDAKTGHTLENYVFSEMKFASEEWANSRISFIVERELGGIELGKSYQEGDVHLWDVDAPVDQAASILDFFADRLKVQQREAGVRHDLIDAVFALGGEDDLVRLLARVHALQSFVATDDGANLLAGYKRAANILKKDAPASSPLPIREGPGVGAAVGGSDLSTEEGSLRSPPTPNPSLEGRGGNSLSYTPEIAEAALIAALDVAEPRTAQAVAAEEFEGAMAALATLRAPIDAFFESVTVNDADPAKRSARLALLARVRDAVHSVADFSKIAG